MIYNTADMAARITRRLDKSARPGDPFEVIVGQDVVDTRQIGVCLTIGDTPGGFLFYDRLPVSIAADAFDAATYLRELSEYMPGTGARRLLPRAGWCGNNAHKCPLLGKRH